MLMLHALANVSNVQRPLKTLLSKILPIITQCEGLWCDYLCKKYKTTLGFTSGDSLETNTKHTF